MEKGLIRYENTTNFNGKAVADFNKFVMKPIFVRLTLVVFAIFALAGVYFMFDSADVVVAIIMWVFSVASVVVMPFVYLHSVDKGVRMNTMCSSTTYLDFCFEDGGVKVFTRKNDAEIASIAIDYRHILKVVEVEGYLYFFVTDTQAYLLDKFGMTNGKINNLIDFLKSKQIKFVVKHKVQEKPVVTWRKREVEPFEDRLKKVEERFNAEDGNLKEENGKVLEDKIETLDGLGVDDSLQTEDVIKDSKRN